MIKVLKMHEDAQLPKCAHPGDDLGWDVYSIESETVEPGQVVSIKTGIAVQVEGINAGFLLRERSGHGKVGIKLLGGVIDPCYQGEWKIMLINLGSEPFVISKGDRIAQAIMLPTLTRIPIDWTESFKTETERGSGGFGSTGR